MLLQRARAIFVVVGTFYTPNQYRIARACEGPDSVCANGTVAHAEFTKIRAVVGPFQAFVYVAAHRSLVLIQLFDLAEGVQTLTRSYKLWPWECPVRSFKGAQGLFRDLSEPAH
jgi:hypothetical protein